MVNLDISSEIKQDTMCGNINGMYFKLLKILVKIACTMCGNENRKTINVLCVETLHFVKLQDETGYFDLLFTSYLKERLCK